MLQKGDIMELKNVDLFRNSNIDINSVKLLDFPDKFTIADEGDISSNLGIVLEGKVHIKAYSLGGKNFTLNTLEPGHIFGDVMLYGQKTNTYPGMLVTQGKTRVAFISNTKFKTMLKSCPILLENFLKSLSDKAFEMNIKSKLLSQDSIRDKILFWVQQEKRIQGTNIVQLHMTKEELANHLFIQRPSLSRELIKMKNEGIIDYDRYTITIKK
jgi:CRP-like cAMP-binding protein